MRVGIVGYPGSGKSTVFEALAPGASRSRQGVAFGNIKVPDARVDALAELFRPKKTTYAEITFADVGGVNGKARGAFSPAVLEHMRGMDVLAHVVRVFDSPMVAEPADPERDESLFHDEIVLLDAAVLERRADRWHRERRTGREVEVNAKCLAHLEDGEALRTLGLDEDEVATLNGIQLLSLKPLVTVYNLSEDAWEDDTLAPLRTHRDRGPNAVSLGLCATIEVEVGALDPADQAEFLEELGLGEPARYPFIRSAYHLLDYISFLTSGEDECRAWPVRRGSLAPRAAGRVHSDLERGFIRAEVHRLDDLLEAGSEAELKKRGQIRIEGKTYRVQDGDVIHFLFNV